MKRTVLYVQGMTCTHCENKIHTLLNQLGVVNKSEVSASKNEVYIYHEAPLPFDQIKMLISEAGYNVIKQKESSSRQTLFLILSLVLLSLLVLRYENQLSFEFIPNIRQSMGYGTLFIVGVLTSFHCVAMCGGINMSQCNKYTSGSSLKPSLLYNTGRVLSYTFIGGLIGGLGTVVSFSGQSRGYVTIFVSFIMILMALRMLKLLHIRLPLPNVNKLFTPIRKKLLNKGPFIVGLANGFMPCGPLQSMQLYALGTGSLLIGALSMFYFSLGTFPLMFGLGFISTLLTTKFTNKVMKYSGLAILLLGVSMFSRGSSLAGFILPFQYTGEVVEAQFIENKQIVEINISSNQYQPIKVVKAIPVKIIIHASTESLNGCNNPLTIPSLGIEMPLAPGENIIEFTPMKEGKIVYTCWMGMITSYIDVVEE